MSNIQHPPVGFFNEGGNPPAQQLFESITDYMIRYPDARIAHHGYTQPKSQTCEVIHENADNVLLFRVLGIPSEALDEPLTRPASRHPFTIYELQYAVLPDGFAPESDQPYPWVSYVLALVDHRPENETEEPYSVLNGANGEQLSDMEIDEVSIVLAGLHKNMLEEYFMANGLQDAPRCEPNNQEFDERYYQTDLSALEKYGTPTLN